MKKKFVTMGVSFLLCVGMIGAGFASWVISRDVEETADGTIKVETVKDARLELSVSETPSTGSSYTGDADLYFGAPADISAISSPWLKVERAQDSNEPTEDLKISLYYQLNCDENGTNLQTLYDSGMTTIKLTFTLATPDKGSEGSWTAYGTAINANYIAEPTQKTQTITFELVKTSDKLQLKQGESSYEVKAGEALEFELVFEYSWGAHFKLEQTNVNPFTYYNTNKTSDGFVSGESGPTWADDAFTALTALEDLNASNNEGTPFTVTVTGKVE